jgi:hypothetical protein
VIATDPGTITRVQGVGFSSLKTRVVTFGECKAVKGVQKNGLDPN